VRATHPGTPELAEALAAIRDAAVVLVEAKVPDGDRDLLLPSISDTLGAFAAAHDGVPPLVIASKQTNLLREIHALAPAVRLAVVQARPAGAGEWRWILGLPVQVVAMRGDLCTPERVADVAAAGHDWYAWTINDPGEARRLRDAGAAAIVTDDPAAITEALRG
jgi:glycerophosphoryl diester phosphodiesterase